MARFDTGAEFAAAMDQVVAGLNENEAVKSRIRSANVSLGVVLSDVPGGEYTISFKDGSVLGTAGTAAGATVTVTAPQDVMDRIFSGKISGESAYYSGALRLRGDEWVAEGLASYIPYMVPLYQSGTAE